MSAAEIVTLYPRRATGQGVEEGNLHNSPRNCWAANLGSITLRPRKITIEVVNQPRKIRGGGAKEATSYGCITLRGSRGSNWVASSSMQNQGKFRPSNAEAAAAAATVQVYSRRKPANYGVTRSLRSRRGALALINGKLRTALTVVNPNAPKVGLFL